MSPTGDAALATSMLSDPRLERLLTIGKEINDLLVKIRAASTFLSGETSAEEFEEVEMARGQLARDLSREYAEANALLPPIDDITSTLLAEQKGLDNTRKMSMGLARIEGLSGSGKQRKLMEAANAAKSKVAEVENLINALDALHKDLGTSRRAPHLCPRCTSAKVAYRITPSELGYTLYRCDECSNAWKITQFSLRI